MKYFPDMKLTDKQHQAIEYYMSKHISEVREMDHENQDMFFLGKGLYDQYKRTSEQ